MLSNSSSGARLLHEAAEYTRRLTKAAQVLVPMVVEQLMNGAFFATPTVCGVSGSKGPCWAHPG